ncbi:CCR4-NOT transcription complex subunit 8-like [Oppia nitens]|uniref:CCR4-NOT transcription complex subunit 8-like n=1 Tax=Oppia nitens TaxID=1686743 RepID=UPI0023DC8C46|nr:CCR4-NOT transcription complex subunit 8-like [Oppia nitens]XP_054160992.1 CCR4-NOT transcription complex subunit 8-like [Oppia nitens]
MAVNYYRRSPGSRERQRTPRRPSISSYPMFTAAAVGSSGSPTTSTANNNWWDFTAAAAAAESDATFPMPTQATFTADAAADFPVPVGCGDADDGIRNVWRHNLAEEFHQINQLVGDYPFVSLDTEFPGVMIGRSATTTGNGIGVGGGGGIFYGQLGGKWFDRNEQNYQFIRHNVDQLKVIQVGLALMDPTGRTPWDKCRVNAWQFNFQFDRHSDRSVRESIDMLDSSGLDFDRLATDGIRAEDFAELLFGSGLVLNPDCKWMAFHGSYDFAYLMKLLTASLLPPSRQQFHELLDTFFPYVYDIKFILNRLADRLPIGGGPYIGCAGQPQVLGGLQDVANQLGLARVGHPHQAASDSLLAAQIFFHLMSNYPIDVNPFCGRLYQLDC